MNLDELLKDCIDENKSSSIDFSVNGTFPTVQGDDTMLRQVFTNLLRNAVESHGWKLQACKNPGEWIDFF